MDKHKTLILAVDDKPQNLQFLGKLLSDNGYEVGIAQSGQQALNFVRKNEPDLILLDIMMPEMDGYDVCKSLKSDFGTRHIPIIFITAKTDTDDIVRGFEVGGVDYVTKPFSVKELTARVKAQLRRSDKLKHDEDIIVVNSMTIDKKQHSVYINDQQIILTLKEYEVLKLLAENKGKVYTRDQLLNQVWGYDYFGETRTVDVHIRHIRKKIEEHDSSNEYIETIRGVGYKIK